MSKHSDKSGLSQELSEIGGGTGGSDGKVFRTMADSGWEWSLMVGEDSGHQLESGLLRITVTMLHCSVSTLIGDKYCCRLPLYFFHFLLLPRRLTLT